MLDILKGIKKVIERFIVNQTPLVQPISSGDNTVSVKSTRRYCVDESIVAFHKPNPQTQAEGEVFKITEITDKNTMVLNRTFSSDYPLENSFVEKLTGFESGNPTFLEAVYIGDPAVIPRYPAITIEGKSRASEWLTLESISNKYEIDISVYVTAADYEQQYELMMEYTKAIETSLFRSFYPLVEPYRTTPLLEDIEADDNTIKIEDDNMLLCKGGWIWLESYDYLRYNRVVQYLGDGVYRLLSAAGRSFSAGDLVVQPGRHVYNTMPHSTQYGTVNKDTLLKCSRINYLCSEEKLLTVPFVDSLTF